MIEYFGANPRTGKYVYRRHKLVLVLHRVNPNFVEMGTSEPHQLKPHQGHLINELQISSDKLRQLGQSLVSSRMNHHTKLNANSMPFQVDNSFERFVICPIGLHNIIMDTGNVAVQRNPEHQVGML